MPTLYDRPLTSAAGASSAARNAQLTSFTCTTGLHGVPSLLISIRPVVYAHATKLLKTMSHRSRGLAPKTVDGRRHTTVNCGSAIRLSAHSASHFVLA